MTPVAREYQQGHSTEVDAQMQDVGMRMGHPPGEMQDMGMRLGHPAG